MFAQSGIAETPTLIVNYVGPFGEDYWYGYSEVHDDANSPFHPPRVLDERHADKAGSGNMSRISETCGAIASS